jgi:hypothetical protein
MVLPSWPEPQVALAKPSLSGSVTQAWGLLLTQPCDHALTLP